MRHLIHKGLLQLGAAQSFKILEALNVHPEQSIDVNIVRVKVVTFILLDTFDDRAAFEARGPAVSHRAEGEQLRRDAFFIFLLHVSLAFLGLLEISPILA